MERDRVIHLPKLPDDKLPGKVASLHFRCPQEVKDLYQELVQKKGRSAATEFSIEVLRSSYQAALSSKRSSG